MKAMRAMGALAVFAGLAPLSALAQNAPRSTSDSVRGRFASINCRVLDMGKDFPADQYNYSLKPEMRSFGAFIAHIAAGNIYAAKAGRGENVNWDELDPKNYKAKEEVVALLEKSISDANATLQTLPDSSFAKSVVERYGTFRRTLWPSCGLLRSGPTRFTAGQTLIRRGLGVSRLPAWHGLRLAR